MSSISAVDWLGWVGAAAVLLAYGLVSARRVQPDAVGFQLLNLLGGALLALNTGYYKAYPSTLVNIIWMGIALYSLRKAAAARPSI